MTLATANTNQPTTKKTALALVKEQVVDQVAKKVDSFLQTGQLRLPKGYSPHNAMHAAWLVLQEIKDKNGKLALETCSKASIANALFGMVVQGLDPLKKQCYFIAYGQHLSCQRSYFGTIAMAQRMAGISEVLPMVRYADEPFKAIVERGRVSIERHELNLDPGRDPNTPIAHAYCIVEFADGREPVTTLMRWDQVQASWKKSRGNPTRGDSPHQEFPDQMAIRTVVNRALKPYINASTDAHLGELLDEIDRVDTVAAAEAEINADASEHANRDVITLDAPSIDDEPELELEENAGPTPEEIAEIQAREAAEASPTLFDAAKAPRARRAAGPGF